MRVSVDRPSVWAWLSFASVIAVVLAIDFVILLLVPTGSLTTKLSLLLGMIGVYSLVVGAISSTDVPRGIVEFVTSHNAAKYFQGNFLVLSGAMASLGNAADPRRGRLGQSFRGDHVLRFVIVNGLVVPVSLLYMVFHVIVVLPFAYLAYAPASLAVAAALNSARPLGLQVLDKETGEEYELLGERWIRDHRVQVTSFAVALPSSALALLLQVI